MNRVDREKALEECQHLRGTMEETQQLLRAMELSRQHVSFIGDDMAYTLDVLRERVEMQAMKLGLLERMLKLEDI